MSVCSPFVLMWGPHHRVIPQQVLNPTSLSRCILEGGHTTVSSSENRETLVLVLNGRPMVSEKSMVERSNMSNRWRTQEKGMVIEVGGIQVSKDT